MKTISLLIVLIGTCIACSSSSDTVSQESTTDIPVTGTPPAPTVRAAKYEPEAGNVLVFVGQDNASVGGNDDSKVAVPEGKSWNNGYIESFKDAIGVPAGVTHYIYMVEENKKNAFGKSFADGRNEGLNVVSEWAAGDMCMRCYLDNESGTFDNGIVHLSISMEFNAEMDVAAGKSDDLIQELGDFLVAFSDHPFLIRIGYEFDGPWNDYDPESFKKAFIRIVDQLRARDIDNFATVMASFAPTQPISVWDQYYPGDAYVDWVGYSLFDAVGTDKLPALDFARMHQKPVFIAESTPWKGTDMTTGDADAIWDAWFVPLFDHIEANTDVIKALSYINADWISQEMWKNSDVFEIDTRLQESQALSQKWIDKMNQDLYIHTDKGTYDLIGFSK